MLVEIYLTWSFGVIGTPLATIGFCKFRIMKSPHIEIDLYWISIEINYKVIEYTKVIEFYHFKYYNHNIILILQDHTSLRWNGRNLNVKTGHEISGKQTPPHFDYVSDLIILSKKTIILIIKNKVLKGEGRRKIEKGQSRQKVLK